MKKMLKAAFAAMMAMALVFAVSSCSYEDGGAPDFNTSVDDDRTSAVEDTIKASDSDEDNPSKSNSGSSSNSSTINGGFAGGGETTVPTTGGDNNGSGETTPVVTPIETSSDTWTVLASDGSTIGTVSDDYWQSYKSENSDYSDFIEENTTNKTLTSKSSIYDYEIPALVASPSATESIEDFLYGNSGDYDEYYNY